MAFFITKGPALADRFVIDGFLAGDSFALNHPERSEKWIQDLIPEGPSIPGLCDLVLKDKERLQPRAGRLDLLFQDPDSSRRFETEIQLGGTDETHVIRTLEYWDVEPSKDARREANPCYGQSGPRSFH